MCIKNHYMRKASVIKIHITNSNKGCPTNNLSKHANNPYVSDGCPFFNTLSKKVRGCFPVSTKILYLPSTQHKSVHMNSNQSQSSQLVHVNPNQSYSVQMRCNRSQISPSQAQPI